MHPSILQERCTIRQPHLSITASLLLVTIAYDYLRQIRFNDVATELGININAARMRYHRLKKSFDKPDTKEDEDTAPDSNSPAPVKSAGIKRAAPKAAAKTSKTADAKISPAKRRKIKQEEVDKTEFVQEKTSQDAYEGDKDSVEE